MNTIRGDLVKILHEYKTEVILLSEAIDKIEKTYAKALGLLTKQEVEALLEERAYCNLNFFNKYKRKRDMLYIDYHKRIVHAHTFSTSSSRLLGMRWYSVSGCKDGKRRYSLNKCKSGYR